VVPDGIVRSYAQTLPTGVDRIGADQNATANIDGVDERVDVDVAVLDTAGNDTHPDLNVHHWTNCTDSLVNSDDDGHGTHVGGTIGALDNDIGVVGVAAGAHVSPRGGLAREDVMADHARVGGAQVAYVDARAEERREQATAAAVADERRRIAREMHDSIAQVLGYVNTKAQAAQALLQNDQPERADLLGRLEGAKTAAERDVIYCLARDGAAMLDWPVEKIMTAPAITVEATMTVLGALSLMTSRRIRHLPVVEGSQLVGVVSIGDLVKHRLDQIEAEAQAMLSYIQTA